MTQVSGAEIDTEVPYQTTLQALMEFQVAWRPTATALICDHDAFFGVRELTFAQWHEKANQVARKLREAGIGPGQIVGILLERSFALMIGLLAILKAGAAYLPLSPSDPRDRLVYMLGNAGVELLLTHRATADKAPPGVQALNLEDAACYAGPAPDRAAGAAPDDLAYVIYTSGSTGRPKGVMIEHRSVVNRLDWMQKAYPIGPGDVLLQKTACTFDVSVWELFWGAINGAALCLLLPGGEKTPVALVEAIAKHRVSVVHFVPSMLNVFLEYLVGRPDRVAGSLASLRRVFASGEVLSPAHVRKFNDLIGEKTGCGLTNLYGPTEATVDATYYDCPTGRDFERIPIGRPIQNLRAYILQAGRRAPPGECGELCLAGIGLARGYLNNPELTRERFVENPTVPGQRIYRTGDLARWLPDGNIEFLGREDEQVKIRGLRIELGEIENTLRAYPGVVDCVVITKRYSESIVVIVAYLVAKAGLELGGLRRYLRQQLPPYMIPGHFETLPALPLTSSGKADRRALPEPRLGARTSLSPAPG